MADLQHRFNAISLRETTKPYIQPRKNWWVYKKFWKFWDCLLRNVISLFFLISDIAWVCIRSLQFANWQSSVQHTRISLDIVYSTPKQGHVPHFTEECLAPDDKHWMKKQHFVNLISSSLQRNKPQKTYCIKSGNRNRKATASLEEAAAVKCVEKPKTSQTIKHIDRFSEANQLISHGQWRVISVMK